MPEVLIDAVIFDIGNVVVRFDDAKGMRQLAALSVERLAIEPKQIFGGPTWRAFSCGQITDREHCDHLRALLRISETVSDDEIGEAIGSVFTPIRETIEVVEAMRKRGIRLVALSNVEPPRDRVVERPGVWSLFDAAVKSYQVRMMKPDHDIYRKALEVAHCARYRALFVDDLEKNVLAAAELGIASHQYKNHEGLLRFLALHGIALP